MKNTLIGLFFIGAIAILVAMILFLDPKVGDGKKTLKVRFANISGIEEGTRVTYAGKPVGQVLSIHEIPHARSEQLDDTGRIYCYLLTLKLDSSVSVFDTDEISIRGTGLMGEKSVAILPKTAQNGRKANLITNEVIIANSIDPLENTFNQINKAAGRMESTLNEFNQWFKANQNPMADTVSHLNVLLNRMDETVLSVQEEKIVPTLHQSTELLNGLLVKASELADQISNGTGTIGRFIGKEDIYLKLNSLLSKGETLMNDINHYGLLFQYDKHWQRSRTKRANILKSLSTPKEFRNYFEAEIDAMTTSLGRLSELLQKAEDAGEKEKIVENGDFKKQFANLLRQVETLFASVKLYNESLAEEP